MQITVKTLQGAKFSVSCDATATIASLKSIVEAAKGADFPKDLMKLICSGKVLKDDQTVESCGMKETDFLVMMISKPKKKPAAEAAAPAAAAPVAAPAPAAPAPVQISASAVAGLQAMGFPEDQCRAALQAADGNPNVAVEFLMSGIPEPAPAPAPAPAAAAPAAAAPAAAAPAAAPADPNEPLAALRSHPQFNDLRRLVQTNPAMLQTVLAQIGTQSPELLTAINENQAAFIQMMNEPVAAAEPAPATPASPVAAGSMPGMPAGLGGLGDPAQLAQMLATMPPDQRAQMAQMVGVSPQQLEQVAQMMGSMPPAQLQQMMAGAMGGGGGGGGPGGGEGQGHQIRLTAEEMEAVNRLTAMGFDRNDAAQAYLACDKVSARESARESREKEWGTCLTLLGTCLPLLGACLIVLLV